MFEKYARAVSDKTERNRLQKLYRIRNTVYGCFFAVCVAIILEALFLEESMAGDDPSTAAMVCFGLSLLCFVCTGIMSLVLWRKFRKAYREILTRPTDGAELPEVAEYRKQTAQEERAENKTIRPALWTMIASIVAMAVCIGVDTFRYPDDDGFHALSIAGIVIAVAGILLYFFVSVRANLQKSQARTERPVDIRSIDEAQGRKYKYSINEDRNLSSYKYLFPTPALRERVETLRKKRNKTMFTVLGVSVSVALVLTLILFSDWVFSFGLRGFTYPVCTALVFASALVAALPYSRKMLAVEKEQKKELQENPAYALHWEIYKKYDAFSKWKGKTVLIALSLGFALSLVLAICFPTKIYSVFGFPVLIAGLLLNNLFVSRLRKEVLPIEQEIDAAQAQ